MKSKITLGAEASVAAGPVRRTAEASTNARMQAQMLKTINCEAPVWFSGDLLTIRQETADSERYQ